MKLRSDLILTTLKPDLIIRWLGILILVQISLPNPGFGRIFIDINAPSAQRIKIALPDFNNLSTQGEAKDLSTALPGVISNDLDLSGFFDPMDKSAFLEEAHTSTRLEKSQLKSWSVIGAELLLLGEYSSIGRSLEVEVRVYDVFWGRQIMARRVLGKTQESRSLMHRIANEIISILTGQKGMFLSKIAFVGTSSGHKEIYISDYDGHNVEQITSDRSIALLPRWSPDGEKIAYNSYKDGGALLYVRDISTGKIRKISAREGLNTGAAWASDSRKLALTLSPKGNQDIYTMDLDGKILERLTTHTAIDVSPAFSPDGTKIAFVSSRSGVPQIYIKDLNDGKEERLTFEGNYNTSPSWSSLNRIAFSGMVDGFLDIYTVDPGGGNLRRLTRDQGQNEDPCWSPDGRYIVFSSNREGGYHLYIMNRNGQNQKRITSSKGEETAPSWSRF